MGIYTEEALKNHAEGCNCAQAVACAFADKVGVDKVLLFKACEGFGAGMGSRKNTCGALSGAVMLCGLANSSGSVENITKKQTYGIAGEIVKEFTEKCSSSVCEQIKQNGKVTCNECIKIATELVSEKVFGEK